MGHEHINKWQHSHEFHIKDPPGEKKTFWVLILTAITMVLEIVAGGIFGSMALLADGWHMGTHAAAFFIAIFAYRYTKKHAKNSHFSFGAGKINSLGGFASSVALAVVALVMCLESIGRLFSPQIIRFNEAIFVAFFGLAINLVSAWILKDSHEHHGHEGHGHHHDHNLKAAYIHVLADAMTSCFAIFALFSGKLFGWNWMDPIMGIVGAAIITKWAYNLMKETAPILLDAGIDAKFKDLVKQTIENDSDNKVADLHVWRVGAHHKAAIISIVTHEPKNPEHYKSLLKSISGLSHITIEVNTCQELLYISRQDSPDVTHN